jgi:hypothetical protein
MEKFKEGLERIRKNLRSSNFQGCANNSQDLTTTSEFVSFEEGVFIGEYFEGLFYNLIEATTLYEHKKEELEPLKKEIDSLIQLIQKTIPSENNEAKAKIYREMVKVRYDSTKFQIECLREREPKKIKDVESPFA